MRYGKVEGLDKKVSHLVLGSTIRNLEDTEKYFTLMDRAAALGCNTLDTAHQYAGGNSERVIGQWMSQRDNREQMVVISKGAHHNSDRKRVTPFDITSDLFDSLARLRTDYIDIYLLHRDDPEMPVGPIVEVLNEHRRAGRIRVFGASNWSHLRIQEANEYAAKRGLEPFRASSPHFSLAEQVQDPWGGGCVSIGGPGEAKAREWYRACGMPVFAYSSLAGGFLSGRITRENFEALKKANAIDGACLRAYCHGTNFDRLDRAVRLAAEKGVTVPQLAISYVLSHAWKQLLNLFALVGPAGLEELEADVEACGLELSLEELEWLDLKRDQI